MKSDINEKKISEQYIPGLVSVIIPTYNRATLLTETLDSVWNQTYRPIELIIIDDGSTDNTYQLVTEWTKARPQSQDFRVYYFKQENSGHSAACNTGIAKSEGEFIQFLDSDDLLHPEKIMRQVKDALVYNTTVYGDCRRFAVDSKGGILFYPTLLRNRKETALKDWFEGRFISPSSFLWKRQDVVQIGPWNEKESFDADGEFSCRFLLKGGTWKFCPDSWSYYRIYLDLLTPSDSKVTKIDALNAKCDTLELFEKKLKELGWFDSLCTSFSYCYWDLAKRAAFAPEIQKNAFSHYRRLNPDGHVPENWPNRILYKTLGISGRKKLTLFLRNYLGIQPFKPIGRVNSVTDLFSISESEDMVEVFREKRGGVLIRAFYWPGALRSRAWALVGMLKGYFSFFEFCQLAFPFFLKKKVKLMDRYHEFLSLELKKKYVDPLDNSLNLFGHKFKGHRFFEVVKIIHDIIICDQYHASQFLKKDSVVFDVGANLGTFSVLAARLASQGKIYAFEPVADIFKDLKENTQFYSNVISVNAGLGDIIGQKKIYVDSIASIFEDSPSYQGKLNGANLELANISTIDSFVAERGIPRVDFIKIDAEGYEAKILNGARETIKRFKPVIVMSAYHNQNDKEDLPRITKEIHPDYICELHRDQEDDFICYTNK